MPQPLPWDSPDATIAWDNEDLTWDGEVEPSPPSMPYQNISAQFTTQALADLKTALTAVNPMFPLLVTLTDAERRSLQRVAAGSEAFCESSINGASTFPTVVPAFLSKVEWDKDENYYDQLAEVEVLVAALAAKVADTKAAVGAERYRQARKFYEAVKAAREDVPGLQALYEQLSEQFSGQGGDGPDEEPPATPPPTP